MEPHYTAEQFRGIISSYTIVAKPVTSPDLVSRADKLMKRGTVPLPTKTQGLPTTPEEVEQLETETLTELVEHLRPYGDSIQTAVQGLAKHTQACEPCRTEYVRAVDREANSQYSVHLGIHNKGIPLQEITLDTYLKESDILGILDPK